MRKPAGDLSAGLLQFLDSCIDSVEQLRILLLLQSDPSRVWTITAISSELRSSDNSVAKRLDNLYSRKVLCPFPESRDRHQYRPASPEVSELILELARENQLRPYRVIDAIYSRPSKALRDFAEAFMLRGDKP